MKELQWNIDPIHQVLKGNPHIKADQRDGLARAICRAVDNDKQGKAIAKAISSPAQFELLLTALGLAGLVELAQKGKDLDAEMRRIEQEQRDRAMQTFFQSVPGDIARNVISFLPLSTRAAIDRQERARVNVIRTGGLSKELHPYIQAPPKRLGYGASSECIVCQGADRHLPPIRESPRTRILASLVVKAIASHAKTKKLYREEKKGELRGYMLGVLEVDGKALIAISGTYIPQDLEKFINSLGHGQFIDVTPSKITAGGALIDSYYMAQMSGNSPAAPFFCAAPKLVEMTRGFVSKGASWSMTEMWCGPKSEIRQHGVAYESCSNCIDILPMMLCTRRPVAPDKKDPEGFKMTYSKSQKKDMKAGRGPKKL